jgi:hypothetical protein
MKLILVRASLAGALLTSFRAAAQPFIIEYDLPSPGKIAIVSILAIAAALSFYRLRCRHRFVYGACEVIASMLWVFLLLFPRSTMSTDVGHMPFFVPPLYKAYGFLAGIYIFVRGMDNMHCGLTSETGRKRWDRLFRCPLPVRRRILHLTSWLIRRE